jgi:general stress protein 26
MAKKDTPANGAKGNGAVKKLRKMMKDIRIAMLTTTARDGSLRSRPMMTSEVEFAGDLWFIARSNSGLADEISGNSSVNVSYANPKQDRYISVTGSASLIQDRDKVRELWSGKHKSWFPDGKKDPDLALVRIDVHFAEFWDASSNSVQLSQFVRPEVETESEGIEEPTGAGAQG